MAAMIDKACECCAKPMKVRKADVARGWGRFCSKRCKAVRQDASSWRRYADTVHPFSSEAFENEF